MVTPPSSPAPFFIARSILSAGMLACFAFVIKVLSLGLNSGSLPPSLVAKDISLLITLNILPRLASTAALCLLVVAHLLCPAMIKIELSNLFSSRILAQSIREEFVGVLSFFFFLKGCLFFRG